MQILLLLLLQLQILLTKTDASAPIADDYEGLLLDDNGSAMGERNNTVDGLMFNMVSYLLRKSYNYVNKVIFQYCFEADNNQRAALTKWALVTKWALEQFIHHNK